jgi:hypothetical protein
MAKLKLKHREIGSHTIRLDEEQVTLHEKVAKLENDIEVAAKRSPYKWSVLLLRSGKTGKLYAYTSWDRAIRLDGHRQDLDLRHAIGGIQGYTITRKGYLGYGVHHQYATRSCAPDVPVALIYPFEDNRWAKWGDYPDVDEALAEEATPLILAVLEEVERLHEEGKRRRSREAQQARPWQVGDQLCEQLSNEGPMWTVIAVRGEYVTIQQGNEKPVRRKVRTGWITPRVRVGTTILARRGWAA